MGISKDHLMKVCKIGQGAKCCRYVIVCPSKGIVCAKNPGEEKIKRMLDLRVAIMNAKGDNCKGWLTYQ